MLSYFTDLQGSQTPTVASDTDSLLSYFTDLQGSQTIPCRMNIKKGLVTLLIYKVLKHLLWHQIQIACLVTLLIYKVLKPE